MATSLLRLLVVGLIFFFNARSSHVLTTYWSCRLLRAGGESHDKTPQKSFFFCDDDGRVGALLSFFFLYIFDRHFVILLLLKAKPNFYFYLYFYPTVFTSFCRLSTVDWHFPNCVRLLFAFSFLHSFVQRKIR